ncbi:hypothetical protein [Umezawaea beigongshangensis]|uniref:hypothetical protein n=1 Tax=Umezawaea beigongshangensis TaxID=2780383 RepID=UPI0018F1E5B2|nr:hypothetical protein [Umezawaea beigongshangensis]
MGGVIIYEPDADSPVMGFPWVVNFEPSGGEEWESFVCGPYERDHAIALAEAVALEEEGMLAVVEPLMPVLSAEEVLATIEELREAEDEEDEESDHVNGTSLELGETEFVEEDAEFEPPTPEEVKAGMERTFRRLLADNS